jgi:branched-chain amino acid aminotransferase
MHIYLNHNGNFILADTPVITPNNRSFRYGDALFETIRITNYNPQFLKEHLLRLYAGMEVLKMEMNPLLNATFLEHAFLELAQKNNITSDGRVRLTVYRNEGGFYAPCDNKVSFLIEVYPLDEIGYTLNNKGYTVDLYTDFKKAQNSLSSIKSANSAIYVMAGIHKVQQQLDECLLLNDKHHIIEGISSNIFAVKNGVLYTPPVADGCVNGVMRKKIIEIKRNIKEGIVIQSAKILPDLDLIFDFGIKNSIIWLLFRINI